MAIELGKWHLAYVAADVENIDVACVGGFPAAHPILPSQVENQGMAEVFRVDDVGVFLAIEDPVDPGIADAVYTGKVVLFVLELGIAMDSLAGAVKHFWCVEVVAAPTDWRGNQESAELAAHIEGHGLFTRIVWKSELEAWRAVAVIGGEQMSGHPDLKPLA